MSTTIKILVKDQIIGAIESIELSESKIQDFTTNIRLKPTRMRFDKAKIKGVFDNGSIVPAEQALPFDIVIEDDRADTKITCVWFDVPNTQMTVYESGDWLIVEGATMQAESIV